MKETGNLGMTSGNVIAEFSFFLFFFSHGGTAVRPLPHVLSIDLTTL